MLETQQDMRINIHIQELLFLSHKHDKENLQEKIRKGTELL